MLLHQARHHLAQRRGAQILALLDHIIVGGDGGYGGRVGGGAADALFLHGADQRGLGIAGGGLGELLVRDHFFQRQLLPLAERGQRISQLCALLVLGLFIHGGVAGEFHLGVIGAEIVAVGHHVHRHTVIHRVCHLAGGEAAPDQPVQAVLLLGQVLSHLLRGQEHVGGADGLMGVLGPCLGFEAAGLAGDVLAAIALGDKGSCRGQGLVGKAQGVGSHVGNQTDAAPAADLHALIELLGDGHGAPGRHAQAAGGLLLQGGGDEGGRGAALLLSPLHGVDDKGRVLHRVDDGVDLRLAVKLLLFVVLAVKTGGKAAGAVAPAQTCVQKPVFLALEILDLLFPVHHHAGGDRLDAAGGKAGLDLFPEQRRELVAHDTV